MDIRINSYIPITNVEGVGTRFAIWVQGCSIHCNGCANFHMWDFNGGTVYNTDDLINLIKQYKTRTGSKKAISNIMLECLIDDTAILNVINEN